ncbi:hypothetical protein CDAR_396521 [Caerostris darwini]|uniref:Uncharacterized protein n=1 Tax=Caerostris darwini TaxID=1538125 RepID=A0AAV4PP14_9ARAC|nr:hypothetical protein CDAR_396521 [Caerostris darwini]
MFSEDYLFYMLKGPVKRDLHCRISGALRVDFRCLKNFFFGEARGGGGRNPGVCQKKRRDGSGLKRCFLEIIPFNMLKGPEKRVLHFRMRRAMGVDQNPPSISFDRPRDYAPPPFASPKKKFFKQRESVETWNKPQQKQFPANSAHKAMQSESGAE